MNLINKYALNLGFQAFRFVVSFTVVDSHRAGLSKTPDKFV